MAQDITSITQIPFQLLYQNPHSAEEIETLVNWQRQHLQSWKNLPRIKVYLDCREVAASEAEIASFSKFFEVEKTLSSLEAISQLKFEDQKLNIIKVQIESILSQSYKPSEIKIFFKQRVLAVDVAGQFSETQLIKAQLIKSDANQAETPEYILTLSFGAFLDPRALYILAKEIQDKDADVYTVNRLLFKFSQLGNYRLGNNKFGNFRSVRNFFTKKFFLNEVSLDFFSLLSQAASSSQTSHKLVDCLLLKESILEKEKLMVDESLSQNFFQNLTNFFYNDPTGLLNNFEKYKFSRIGLSLVSQRLEDYLESNPADTPATHLEVLEKIKQYQIPFTLQPQSKKVQVIIPYKNKVEITINCLKSLELQDCKDDLEVFLVDNETEVSEQQKLESFVRGYSLSQQTKIVNLKSYFNFALSNNTGAKYSEAPFLLLLNNDTKLENVSAISELRFYLGFAKVGVVGGKLIYPNKQVQHQGIRFSSHGPVNLGAEVLGTTLREVSATCFAFTMIKRELFSELGGLDEVKCPNTYGDVLFCLRARKLGWKVLYNPLALATHYETQSRIDFPKEIELKELFDEGGSVAAYQDFFCNPNLESSFVKEKLTKLMYLKLRSLLARFL